MYQSQFFKDLIKTVYQMFNYEMKLDFGVVALNNEIATFQAKKPSPNNTITLTPGLLIIQTIPLP